MWHAVVWECPGLRERALVVLANHETRRLPDSGIRRGRVKVLAGRGIAVHPGNGRAATHAYRVGQELIAADRHDDFTWTQRAQWYITVISHYGRRSAALGKTPGHLPEQKRGRNPQRDPPQNATIHDSPAVQADVVSH